MSNQIPWQRLWVEGFVIVVSILLAFGIDAWWQNVGEQAAEAAAIAGIHQDFVAHSAVIDEALGYARAREDAAAQLFEAMRPQGGGTDPDVAQLIDEVWSYNDVRFQGGTLESLFSGPGLTSLSDPELRQLLSAWRQEVSDFDQVNRETTSEIWLFVDYLSERFPIADLDPRSDLPESGFRADLSGLQNDFRFSNLIYRQYSRATVGGRRLGQLEAIAEAVLARVEVLQAGG